MLVAGLLLGIPSWLMAADWPQWLGPTRNGQSPETVAAWTEQPAVLWRHAAGPGFGSPVVAEGRVFLHTAVPGADAESVVALDAETGNELWSDSYPRAPYASDLGTGPRATPAAIGGRLYCMGITGIVTCYNARSGERLWQANPYEELGAVLPGFGACSSPVVAGDRLVALVGGAGKGVVAYDVHRGRLAWKTLDEPAGTASPIVRSTRSGERLEVIVQTTLRLAGLDAHTGDLNWSHPLVFEPSGVAPTPLLSGRRLLCATRDTGALMLTLPDSAEESPRQEWWNQDSSTYFSTGAIAPAGEAYVVTNALLPLPRADVARFSSDSDTPVWTAEGLGYFHVGMILLADGALLVLDDSGNLVLHRPESDGLHEQARAKVCGGTFASPALADGRLYVRDGMELLCIELVAAPAAAEQSRSE